MYKYLFLLLISCQKTTEYKEPEIVMEFVNCDKFDRCLATTNYNKKGWIHKPEIGTKVCGFWQYKEKDFSPHLFKCEK